MDWLGARDHGRIHRALAAHARAGNGLAADGVGALGARELALVRRAIAAASRPRAAPPRVSPRDLRALLFTAAARTSREEAKASTARHLGISLDELEAALFADVAPATASVEVVLPTVSEVVRRANELTARALLARSTRVRLLVPRGGSEVARAAVRRGLLLELSRACDGRRHRLRLAGPLSLPGGRSAYRRALGDVVIAAVRETGCAVEVDVALARGPGTIAFGPAELSPDGEPARAAAPPADPVLARLARDLARLEPELCIVEAPEPLAACGALELPDLALHHPGHARPLHVQLLRRSTPTHLRDKLTRLIAAGVDDLVVCVPAGGSCVVPELGSHLLPYRRRVDAGELLARLALLATARGPRALAG